MHLKRAGSGWAAAEEKKGVGGGSRRKKRPKRIFGFLNPLYFPDLIQN
jgi:hypothetical protein